MLQRFVEAASVEAEIATDDGRNWYPARKAFLVRAQTEPAAQDAPNDGNSGGPENKRQHRYAVLPERAGAQRSTDLRGRAIYFLYIGFEGATGGGAAAGEIAKVTHVFQPSARRAESNSQYVLRFKYACSDHLRFVGSQYRRSSAVGGKLLVDIADGADKKLLREELYS
jgi:hypothetical protein